MTMCATPIPKRAIGRTKAQVLRTIQKYEIAEMRCSEIASAHLITFAQSLAVQPQTVQNYLSHLAAVFAELSAHFTPKQCMDAVFTAGQYTQVSMFLNTFGVQLDEGQTLDPDLKGF